VSVIVFRDGILASDSRAYGGDYQASPGTKQKLFKLADGSRVGVASATLGQPERFVAFLRGEVEASSLTGIAWDMRAIVVKPDGSIYLAESSVHMSGPIQCEFYAIGSGAKYALGAIFAGATAVEAVEAAIRFDPHCGGDVRTL